VIGVILALSIKEEVRKIAHFVGLDVSVQETAACVVDEVGRVICEHKGPNEPDDIAVLLRPSISS